MCVPTGTRRFLLELDDKPVPSARPGCFGGSCLVFDVAEVVAEPPLMVAKEIGIDVSYPRVGGADPERTKVALWEAGVAVGARAAMALKVANWASNDAVSVGLTLSSLQSTLRQFDVVSIHERPRSRVLISLFGRQGLPKRLARKGV